MLVFFFWMNDVFVTRDLKATEVFEQHPTDSHMPEVQLGGLSYKTAT